MKKRKKERRSYTIQALRRVVLFGFIVPILVMQLLQNYFALESFVREVEQGGKSTIYLYQNQLETSMARIEKTVASYWAQDYSMGVCYTHKVTWMHWGIPIRLSANIKPSCRGNPHWQLCFCCPSRTI